MGVTIGCEQLSLSGLCVADEVATSCGTGISTAVRRVEDWMRQLVTDGEYVVDVGGYDCVLKPTRLGVGDIPQGHKYYHYLIGQKVYAGVFVGGRSDG